MNMFHWLLILGFPPSVAAATVAPEIFTDAETVEFPTTEFLPRSAAA